MIEAIFSLFSPETAGAAAEVVGGVSDVGITGAAIAIAFKFAAMCSSAKTFFEAQTDAVRAVVKAADCVCDAAKKAEHHIEHTEQHQRRLEGILESAA